MSPSWISESRVGSMPSPSRSIQAIRLRVSSWNFTVPCPIHWSGTVMWSTPDGARRVAEVGFGAGGQNRRSTWSAVHLTVATVVMPSRW